MTNSASPHENADYRLEPGFQYPERRISISSAEQHRLHGWCDMAPEVFGDIADPSLVGRLPMVIIANTIAAGRPGWGQVHTIHRITQRRPIKLGESLTLQGVIDGFEPHPRGQVLKSTWRYIDRDGETPFEVNPDGLLIDPAFESKRPQRKPKTESTDLGAERGYQPLLTKRCTPEATVGYCQGSNNPIHSDIEIAQQFGFRVPILAGTQTMSFLLEPLYRNYSPQEFFLTIGFMRPVFWDDDLEIEATKKNVYFDHIKAINADKKCVADCVVQNLRE